MLKFFRKHSSGTLTKTLMLLLALTFVLWGIGDVINRQNRVIAFKVADREVSFSEWQEALAQQVRGIEIEIGKKLTPEEISSFGIQKMVLNQLINKMLLEKEAEEMGILVSDDMAKFEISSMPIFIKDGKFNNDSFYRFLGAVGSTEEQFVEQMKSDIAVSNLKLAFTLNKDFPKVYTNALGKARAVNKEFDLYEFDIKSVKLDSEFTDTEASLTYEQNKERFALPEMRNISYVELNLNNIKSKFEVSEEQLKDAYEARKEIFELPETRDVLQIIFKDKSTAKEAIEKLDKGEDFLKVAKAYFPKQNDFSLGDKVSIESFDGDISKYIFKADKGSHTGVAKSPLGYHIFFVKDIKPAEVKSFKQVKAELEEQLVMEKKYDEFLSLVQDIEQDILGVQDLAEIAAKYSLKLKKVDSLKASDATNDKDMRKARFADIAFSLSENAISNAYPLDEKGGYFIMQVNKVEPKQYKGIEVVKNEVKKLWKKEKLQSKFSELSSILRAEITEGKEDKQLSLTPKVKRKQSLSWNTAKVSALPEMLKDEILKSSNENITVPVVSEDGSKYYIAKVKKTEISKPDANSDLNLELAVGSMEVYLAQYLNYLHQKYDVEIYNIGEVE